MIISFTGHRNKLIDKTILDSIANKYPGAIWVHGGAKGFDSQVCEYAKSANITQEVIKPNYTLGRSAPLIRNREIVDRSHVLVACYDGRKTGGTYYTINYAKKCGKTVFIHEPNITI